MNDAPHALPAWCSSCEDFVGHKVESCPHALLVIYHPAEPHQEFTSVYRVLMRSPEALKIKTPTYRRTSGTFPGGTWSDS